MIYCKNIMNVTLFFYSPQISEPHFFPPIFGNVIATIVTIFIFPISAMALPQLVCQKKNFFSLRVLHALTPGQQNWAQEIRYPRCRNLGRNLKKNGVTFTIFLQYFHNKSQVISYY